MNKTVLDKLKTYIYGFDVLEIDVFPAEGDRHSFDFIDREEDEVIASANFDEEGLANFSIYNDEESQAGPLNRDALINKAYTFIDEFFPQNFSDSLCLSALIDMGDFTMIVFNQKDKKFGLELPNSGVSFSIMPNGIISHVERDYHKVEVIYPGSCITAAKAKNIFLKELRLVPVVAKYDKETYVNGDNRHYFVYEIEDYVMEVGADGKLQTIEMFGVEQQQYAGEVHLPNPADLYTLAGLTEDHMKIYERKTKKGRIEVWSEKTKEELAVEDAELAEIQLAIPNTVKMLFNQDGGLLRLLSENNSSNETAITAEQALEKANEVIAGEYTKNANTFQLLQGDPELHHYINQEHAEKYAYRFCYHRFEQGIKVQNAMIAIEISAKTAALLRVETDQAIFTDLSMLNIQRSISVEEAAEPYKKGLSMELSWVKDLENGMYSLAFVPSFPQTKGHIRCINATSGEPWIIDTSCMEEFE
ncbi:YcdB/YcdC domain-containing protein [Cytobacillus gottheilii]|uniref:YcdB/YcdC domain-containing protein n=1 Tax=Cytobacillus gottheilii TaxID=859144 RepID=UPI0009BB9D85|nr:YcdB/YcdC domain-containing protein [Cytobacillus gottheilii]